MSRIIKKFRGGIKCLREHGFVYTAKLLFSKIKNNLKILCKKILTSINNISAKLGKRLELGFITIIKPHTYIKDDRSEKIKFIFLFGKQIYPRKKNYRATAWADPAQPVMYFKINRMSDYAKPCVQHWVNIAYHMKADYYFICDNTELQYHLLRTVNFPGSDIKFIPSIRKPLKNICKKIATGDWGNATYAHLTPFYHAKDNKHRNFWAIDADDMMICLKHSRVANLLCQAQIMAKKEEISALSLDIWRSRTLGRHWSWGIVYVNDNVDFCKVIEDNLDENWFYPYKNIEAYFNLDWFFTYLKDYKNIKIESFYAENMYLIHWGNFLRSPLSAAVLFWSNEKLTFPIMKYVFHNDSLGTIDIADCKKIDIGATQYEGLKFLENEVTILKNSLPVCRKLHNYGDFSKKENSIERL